MNTRPSFPVSADLDALVQRMRERCCEAAAITSPGDKWLFKAWAQLDDQERNKLKQSLDPIESSGQAYFFFRKSIYLLENATTPAQALELLGLGRLQDVLREAKGTYQRARLYTQHRNHKGVPQEAWAHVLKTMLFLEPPQMPTDLPGCGYDEFFQNWRRLDKSHLEKMRTIIVEGSIQHSKPWAFYIMDVFRRLDESEKTREDNLRGTQFSLQNYLAKERLRANEIARQKEAEAEAERARQEANREIEYRLSFDDTPIGSGQGKRVGLDLPPGVHKSKAGAWLLKTEQFSAQVWDSYFSSGDEVTKKRDAPFWGVHGSRIKKRDALWMAIHLGVNRKGAALDLSVAQTLLDKSPSVFLDTPSTSYLHLLAGGNKPVAPRLHLAKLIADTAQSYPSQSPWLVKNSEKSTPLMIAIHSGNARMAERLFRLHPKAAIDDVHGSFALAVVRDLDPTDQGTQVFLRRIRHTQGETRYAVMEIAMEVALQSVPDKQRARWKASGFQAMPKARGQDNRGRTAFMERGITDGLYRVAAKRRKNSLR